MGLLFEKKAVTVTIPVEVICDRCKKQMNPSPQNYAILIYETKDYRDEYVFCEECYDILMS